MFTMLRGGATRADIVDYVWGMSASWDLSGFGGVGCVLRYLFGFVVHGVTGPSSGVCLCLGICYGLHLGSGRCRGPRFLVLLEDISYLLWAGSGLAKHSGTGAGVLFELDLGGSLELCRVDVPRYGLLY